jgi:GT2 family glycosyltransferase
MPELRVTVVLLTHNRREQALRTVRALQGLPEQPPLIVVDNASMDGTAQALAEAYPELALLRAPRNLGAAARNLGAAQVQTPYVAFCDDDVCWHDGALSHAATLLDAHPRIAVLCAQVLVGAQAKPDPTSLQMAASPLPSDGLPGRAIAGYLAGACVMRVQAFLQVGGYRPELFIGGEEELVALDLLAAGWQLVYAPSVVAHHFPSPHRDAPRRCHLLARNAIWVACMRYPPRDVLRRAWRQLREAARRHGLWALVRDTAAGLPWALSERHVLPRAVRQMLRQVQRA